MPPQPMRGSHDDTAKRPGPPSPRVATARKKCKSARPQFDDQLKIPLRTGLRQRKNETRKAGVRDSDPKVGLRSRIRDTLYHLSAPGSCLSLGNFNRKALAYQPGFVF